MLEVYLIFQKYLLIGGLLSLLCLLPKLISHIWAFIPAKKLPVSEIKHKFAIVIPAKNESKIIDKILTSIQNLDYPKELISTFVLVESQNDPTCNICIHYTNTYAFVRPNLIIKTKGGALNQFFETVINKEKQFDAYFVFDADNELTPDYLNLMNDVFAQGADVGKSFLNSKNWNDGYVSANSCLTFSLINTMNNKYKSRFKRNITISGTSFYVSDKLLRQMNGWNFVTLTEDYEFTNYCILNNISTYYYPYAQVYNEEPNNLKETTSRRIRWLKGYSQSNGTTLKFWKGVFQKGGKNKMSKLSGAIGITPILITILWLVVYMLSMLVMTIICVATKNVLWLSCLQNLCISIIGVYLALALYNLLILIAELPNIKISFFNAFLTILFSPIYMGLYLPIYIYSVFSSKGEWLPTKRNQTEKVTMKKEMLEEVETKETINI